MKEPGGLRVGVGGLLAGDPLVVGCGQVALVPAVSGITKALSRFRALRSRAVIGASSPRSMQHGVVLSTPPDRLKLVGRERRLLGHIDQQRPHRIGR
jgi:hypothetical protein